jgi:prepilin-type N-terminal cleavage/methylation domain-containing protein
MTRVPPGGNVRNEKKGFSLIELLVVMAIIMVLGAIGLPNMLRSIMLANETSAVQSLRTLNEAAIVYTSNYGGYPTTLTQMGPSSTPAATGGTIAYPGAADLIDSRLVTGIKSGYTFNWVPGPTDALNHTVSYTITATPIYPGVSGQRTFYTDTTGIIRSEISTTATASSSPIG